MRYERPTIEMLAMDFNLLSGSGPEATSIGSPNVEDNAKEYSVWDEEDNTNNINKEEQNYEDWI